MEPIAASSSRAPLVRPAALPGDVSAALGSGRMLTGEVIQTLDGGSVVLGVDGHRVPADTKVELRPGQRFLMQAGGPDGEVVLRLLPDVPAGVEPALIRALRSLLGREVPVGELLERLAATLRAEIANGGAKEASEALLRRLGDFTLQPGGGGEALRELASANGLAYEAAWLAAAAVGGEDSAAEALKSLAATLRARLSVGANPAPPASSTIAFERALSTAIERLGGMRFEGHLAPADLARIAAAFEAELAATLRATTTGPTRDAWLARLDSLEPGELLRGREGLLLRALLNFRGSFGADLARNALSGFGGGLRGELLAAALDQPDGPLRTALVRALDGLDLGELLHLARREFGEAQHWSFPFPDGAGWTTVDMLLERDGGAGGGGAPEADEGFRVTIGVRFSRLGPVRADLVVRSESVTARLAVALPAVAQLLRQRSAELEELLSSGGRRVRLAVVDSSPAEADVEGLAHDIAFLRENRLMDIEG